MIEDAERSGRAPAGGRRRRADERQHGHRPRARLRGPRVPLHPRDAREHEPRAPAAPRGVRRRGRAHARATSRSRAPSPGRARSRRHAGRLHAAAVRQRREPARPRATTTAREILDGHAGPLDRRLRRRRRHGGHDQRRGRGAAARGVARAARSWRSSPTSCATHLARRARPDEDPGPRGRLRAEELPPGGRRRGPRR